jgi:hypothetical protein
MKEEIVICCDADECSDKSCGHIKPHKKNIVCDEPCYFESNDPAACIKYIKRNK